MSDKIIFILNNVITKKTRIFTNKKYPRCHLFKIQKWSFRKRQM